VKIGSVVHLGIYPHCTEADGVTGLYGLADFCFCCAALHCSDFMYITLTLANSIEVRNVSTGLNTLSEERVMVSFVKFCLLPYYVLR
jgi:hypothetical protein